MRSFLLACLALTALLVACASPPGAEGTAAERPPETDAERALYGLGTTLGASLPELRVIELTPREREVVLMGARDLLAGTPSITLPGKEATAAFMRERLTAIADHERAAGEALLAEVAAQPGAERLDSGAVVLEHVPGEGEPPRRRDGVRVVYQGWLRDGKLFTDTQGEPQLYLLGGLPPCLVTALIDMAPGARKTIVCPTDMVYGDAGQPPAVPPGAVIRYQIELLDILRRG